METQYKLAARSAQLLAKDAPQDEAARVMATIATAKSQLSKASATSVGRTEQQRNYYCPVQFFLEYKKYNSYI